MHAYVADLVPRKLRATSYGVFSMFIGIGTLIGGTIASGLYQAANPVAIIITSCAFQFATLILLMTLLKRSKQ